MNTLKNAFKEILHYPSAIMGSVMIVLLVIIAAYAMISIPYEKAITLWRGGESVWYRNPKIAPPAWMNWFSKKKLPLSFVINANEGNYSKVVEPQSDGSSLITLTYTFDHASDGFPQEMLLYFKTNYVEKQPFVSLTWNTPDGRNIRAGDLIVRSDTVYRFSQDNKLKSKLGGKNPQEGLFLAKNSSNDTPVKGTYQVIVSGVAWEVGSDIDAEFVFHGQLYGPAGTDNQRRDLMVALLWGVPVALAFGLIASVGTLLMTMFFSALGAWYGGWVDGLIQRITEVNLVLPFLSILIMVGTLYSRSIWVILGVTIILSIFSGQIKAFRAAFMQIKEATYIEAAKAYGASNFRLIFLYLSPRMVPTLIPGLVSNVPAFVFLEASLAVLGLGDPTLPTWGKVINDAFSNGALYKGQYYWILEPSVLLMITGLAFALLGFALDRIFNPRLREA
jgi:peptide/nickel transport system permease protein